MIKNWWMWVLGGLGLGAGVALYATRRPRLTPSAPSSGPRALMSVSPSSDELRIDTATLGAEAPMVPGERVTFHAHAADASIGVLEGTYAGPEDPSGPSRVSVDRMAYSGEVSAVGGKYAIPPSKKSGYHTYLERVRWEVIPPEGKLHGFDERPDFDVGSRVELLVRDMYGTKVIAVARVRKLIGSDGLEATLEKPHRVLKDEGAGDIVFPRTLDQATVRTSVTNLIDASSIPVS